MPKLDAKWPTRADHRFILKLASMVLADKFHPIADEFDRVSRVFLKAEGSWKRIFHGSIEDINLLKTVLKVAFKQGYITKKGSW